MKTHSEDDNDLSRIAVVAVIIFASVVILTAIGVLVTVQ